MELRSFLFCSLCGMHTMPAPFREILQPQIEKYKDKAMLPGGFQNRKLEEPET